MDQITIDRKVLINLINDLVRCNKSITALCEQVLSSEDFGISHDYTREDNSVLS